MKNTFVCPSLENGNISQGEQKFGQLASLSGKAMYQAALLNRTESESDFLKIPLNYNTELIAFGGNIVWNGRRFISGGYMMQNIDEIESLLQLEYQDGLFDQVYACLEEAAPSDKILLCVEGPFSVLCALIDMLRVVRGMKTHRQLITDVLEHMTDILSQYLIRALQLHVKVISLADPVGSVQLLGRKRYSEFCGTYIIRLLKQMEPFLDNACIHLCGKCSTDLENCGLVTSRSEVFHGNYGNAMQYAVQTPSIHVIGHGCVNCESLEVNCIHIMKPIEKSDVL
ncbi:MAG: uroporphyrinogen decarboxylase family protein [Ruminococcus sp.]